MSRKLAKSCHWVFLLGMMQLLSASCKAKTTHLSALTELELESESKSESQSQTCSSEGLADRRKKTFERTASCAADVAGIGLAEVLKSAAAATREFKDVAKLVKEFNSRYSNATNLTPNLANGRLCARILIGEYLPVKTFTEISEHLIKSQGGVDNDGHLIDEIAMRIATGGTSEIFEHLGKLMTEPTLEETIKVASTLAGSAADLYTLFSACTPILANTLQRKVSSISNIGKFSKSLGNIGVVGALVNCSSAGLFNAIDVGTEYACLQKDLEIIQAQNMALARAQDASCKKLGQIGATVTSLPIMRMTKNINEVDPKTGALPQPQEFRATLCHQVIFSWSNCLASQELRSRSQAHCERLCKGEEVNVNAQYEINRVFEATNLPAKSTLDLIHTFNQSCLSRGNPLMLINSGIKGCVKSCMAG